MSTARMSLNAAAIRSGRLRVVCAADGARGREVTDEMTVTVECEFTKLNKLINPAIICLLNSQNHIKRTDKLTESA